MLKNQALLGNLHRSAFECKKHFELPLSYDFGEAYSGILQIGAHAPEANFAAIPERNKEGPAEGAGNRRRPPSHFRAAEGRPEVRVYAPSVTEQSHPGLASEIAKYTKGASQTSQLPDHLKIR